MTKKQHGPELVAGQYVVVKFMDAETSSAEVAGMFPTKAEAQTFAETYGGQVAIIEA